MFHPGGLPLSQALRVSGHKLGNVLSMRVLFREQDTSVYDMFNGRHAELCAENLLSATDISS